MEKEKKNFFNTRILQIMLVEGFKSDEIYLIAVDLNTDPESILSQGAIKDRIASDLVSWCNRQGKLENLAQTIQGKNPHIFEKYKVDLEKPDSGSEGRQAEIQNIQQMYDNLQTAETESKSSETKEETISKVDHPLSKDQEVVRRWFREDLTFEEQAFVIGTALFSGLQRHDLMAISSSINEILRPTLNQVK